MFVNLNTRSPTINGSNLAKDCVAADITDHLYWSEEDCAIILPFICVEVTECGYPVTYGSIHRDECYHFRHDPLNRHPGPYTKTIEQAEENCRKTQGCITCSFYIPNAAYNDRELAPVQDLVTGRFFHDFGIAQPNATYNWRTKFWVPLYDKASASRVDASERSWEWRIQGLVAPFNSNSLPFVTDEFQIMNVGKEKSQEELTYEARCMYGDPYNHTYGNPFAQFNPHHYARSKSCSWNEPEKLAWLWTSTFHLKHVYTGLCLTAPYGLLDETEGGLSPGVRVLPCNLSEPLQQWVCQSRNPLHIKLRSFKSSMIFDKVEAFDRVHMAGPHYSEDCKSLWRTLVDNNYICDERYRPGGEFCMKTVPLYGFSMLNIYVLCTLEV
ncbi:uncharacterized protein LOC144745429 [Ciona intestinalis]